MNRRILLVDDEAAILLTLGAILTRYGFSVDTASSGHEGITKLSLNQYHMVITDMKMETELAGYDVIRAANKTDYRPAVAILTAFPSFGKDWRKEGAQCLLIKPMNTPELLQRIETLLAARENRLRKSKLAELRPASPDIRMPQVPSRSRHGRPSKRDIGTE